MHFFEDCALQPLKDIDVFSFGKSKGVVYLQR